MRTWRRASLIGVIIMLAWTAPAPADVTVETAIKSGGVRGLGAFEGTTVSTISGLKQREESTIRFTGAFMGMLQRMGGGGERSVTITRVDRDLIWTLDPEKKSYTEQPITARRLTPGAQPREQEKSDVVVTRSEFKVTRSGANRAINNFPCEEYVTTWLVETLNQKTQERGRSLMKSVSWTTPETADLRRARDEEQAYHQAYLKKVGLDVSPEEAKRFGLAMFAGFSGASEKEIERGLARAADELKKIQGYPILTQVEWTIEGQEGSGGSAGGGSRSREEQSESPGDVGSLLGRLFGGGQSQSSSQSGSQPGGGAGGPLITLTTEVKGVRVTAVPASQFEVPSDYARR